jgi:hypothetical protein
MFVPGRDVTGPAATAGVDIPTGKITAPTNAVTRIEVLGIEILIAHPRWSL